MQDTAGGALTQGSAPARGTTPLTRAMETIKRLKAELAQRRGDGPVAVVGVGLRLPGGITGLDTYWGALHEGRDLVRPLSDERKKPFAAQWADLPHRGGFLDDVFGFDAEFFGIRGHEARSLDPQHRLLLEVVWEALEDAALPPDRLSTARVGLYTGLTNHDYEHWRDDDPEFGWILGNMPCFAAGRVSYTLGLRGPAMSVDTACSSSLVTVHLARQALARGECEVALAGGVNLIVAPHMTRLMSQSGLLAPDGLCKPFDARANGFTRSEGCGIVVLKRLDDAVRDGDRIHAVIEGSAVNHDGRSTSISAPNVLAQAELIRAALDDAGLEAADIGLVETHGTGTALGDPIEMEAITEVLGRPSAGANLWIGSAKANLGHLEAAAGIAGLVKAILSLQHRIVPPLVHYRTLNPRIDLAGTGITMPTAPEPWEAGANGRHAAVNSFGLSGTNAQVILRAAGPREVQQVVPVDGFELSAKTPQALRELAHRYHTHLDAAEDAEYPAFAYTATEGRARHPHRSRITAPDRTTALTALRALADGADAPASAEAVDDGVRSPYRPLPRRVTALPAYPWQRRHYAVDPPTADASSVRH
ncbi:beta-ketoacyl synthase N-terminal-like domain-containing protein [Streptomyces sp. NPDC048342]|uniref:type I polyketide synthase n=1 Tax=unclassified Streptomyces TaxID=2593676 RepID=UPI003447B4E9